MRTAARTVPAVPVDEADQWASVRGTEAATKDLQGGSTPRRVRFWQLEIEDR